MAGKAQHKYPPHDKLVDLIVEAGGIAQASRRLNISDPGLRHHLNRNGLVDKVRERLQKTVTVEDGEPRVSEVEMLRQRNRELEQAVKAQRAEIVFDERVMTRLEESIPKRAPRYKPAAIRKAGMDQHEVVLLFSDTHAGEVVSSGETLGMNEYSWPVMLRRMARLQASVLSYVQHRPYPINKLHVWFLGDMLSGEIHDELAQTNELCGAEATVQFALDAAAWLEEFTPHFAEIAVTGVPGNHPRRTQKPAAKRAHNNDDWLAYKMVELQLRDHPGFSFDFPIGAFATTTVADRWRCLLMHGDGIRSTMPGVPWGGVVRRITTLEQQFNKAKQPIDVVALGHFHTANALDGVGVKTFLNGSVKGLDEYSLKQFGSGRAPSQLLLTFHPRRGITDVSYLDLEDTQPAAVAA